MKNTGRAKKNTRKIRKNPAGGSGSLDCAQPPIMDS